MVSLKRSKVSTLALRSSDYFCVCFIRCALDYFVFYVCELTVLDFYCKTNYRQRGYQIVVNEIPRISFRFQNPGDQRCISTALHIILTLGLYNGVNLQPKSNNILEMCIEDFQYTTFIAVCFFCQTFNVISQSLQRMHTQIRNLLTSDLDIN